MAVNRDKVLREAEKLVQKGRVDAAIREYEKLLKANPSDANTINRVGDLYGRLGEIDKAVELYERIARHFQQDGFIPKAIAILKKINRLVPQRLDIFEQLADLYLQQGLVVEATNQYRVLADWYLRNDEIAKAIDAHGRLVQLDPSNHMAHLKLADLLLGQGHSDRALAVYDKLGRMLLERGKLDEAERLYAHVMEQEPPDAEIVAPLVEALLDAGRDETARTLLERARATSPGSEKLRVLEVRSLLNADGGPADALATAERILAEQPENIQVRLMVGGSLLNVGEAQKARELMVPALEKLLSEGNFARAQQVVQDLLKASQNDQQVLSLALRAFKPSGNEEMLFTLRAALADQYFRSDQHDLARRLYMEVLSSDPTNKLFRQRLAQIDGIDVGDVAIPEASQPVSSKTPAAGEPQAAAAPRRSVPFDVGERLAEAAVFAKYGLADKAIHHLEEILRHFPDNLDAGEKLIQLLLEQDRTSEAESVARPIVEQLRSSGDSVGLMRLTTLLPGLDVAEPSPEAFLGSEDGDEVILIDVDQEFQDDGLDHEQWAGIGREVDFGEQPLAAEPGSEAEEVLEFDFDDLGASAESPGALEAEFDAEAEELDSNLVVDLDLVDPQLPAPRAGRVSVSPAQLELDQLERSLLGRAGGEAIQLPSSRRTAGSEPAPVPIQEFHEEMVDIGGDLAGPSSGELEQVDFFIAQDLYEDALRLLERLDAEYPGDPDVSDRRLVLKSKGFLIEEVSGIHEAPEELFAEEEDYVDLARELEQELAAEEAMVEEATGRGKDEALLEEVFREFQKGVAEQLSEEDSDTHFNLGIAYKEMGLIPEAIREFQIASRDPQFFVECCSMIGVCYLEQGIPASAAEWFERALEAPTISADSSLALRYDLASALEMAGDLGAAHDVLEQIAGERSDFRDVGERLMSLSQQRRAN